MWRTISQLVNVEEDIQRYALFVPCFFPCIHTDLPFPLGLMIFTLLVLLKTFNTALQQTLARVFGRLSYELTPLAEIVVDKLLGMVESGVSLFSWVSVTYTVAY